MGISPRYLAAGKYVGNSALWSPADTSPENAFLSSPPLPSPPLPADSRSDSYLARARARGALAAKIAALFADLDRGSDQIKLQATDHRAIVSRGYIG
jgi:hypothetical protein